MSRKSGLLANDKGDNEMIPGLVHRSPGIYHTAEKTLARRPFDESSETTHRLKWGLLPQTEVSRIAQHVRKE